MNKLSDSLVIFPRPPDYEILSAAEFQCQAAKYDRLTPIPQVSIPLMFRLDCPTANTIYFVKNCNFKYKGQNQTSAKLMMILESFHLTIR